MADAQNSVSTAVRSIRLKDAFRQARIEAADRTSVVFDLRDAEIARLEILNEILDPLLAEIPVEVELFDRGISQVDTPLLWIDAVAYVVMGRELCGPPVGRARAGPCRRHRFKPPGCSQPPPRAQWALDLRAWLPSRALFAFALFAVLPIS